MVDPVALANKDAYPSSTIILYMSLSGSVMGGN